MTLWLNKAHTAHSLLLDLGQKEKIWIKEAQATFSIESHSLFSLWEYYSVYATLEFVGMTDTY